jgi:hypothetical protein
MQDWYAYLRAECLDPGKEEEKQWLREHFHELGGGCSATVPPALVNGADIALHCLRRWPEQAAEIVRECSLDVVRPGYLGQRILDNRGSGGPAQDVLAIHAVSAAASAVQGRGALTVANVHICGEGYAGKSMTRQALMKSYAKNGRVLLAASPPLPDINLKDGRTRGMVRDSLDMVVSDDGKNSVVRVLFHDYGGQEEFRANHAAHLAAPNSVYLLVMPLWDKRPKADNPNQSVDKPMELEYLVKKYRDWLKFINTVVSKGSQVECITELNFANQYRKAEGVQELQKAVDALKAVSDEFKGDVMFSHDPILVNAKKSASVHRRIVTPLREAIAKLAHVPIPVSPALQTVLADMQVKDKWPLFSYESDLQTLLRAAIREKHPPSVELASDPAVAEEVVRTIVEITQGLLESRRDIVVISVQGGGRISINRPNWLTEQLLGSLFDPRRRLDINQAAALRAVQHQGEPTHLLSGADIHGAVEATLDASTRAMLDAHFIPKLLQHLGVCIPVVVGPDGFARGVAEGDDLARVMHWVPAFSTTAMADKHAIVLPNADHVVARQFKLADPEFCMFPPGYFSSLSVDIVSLYNRTNLVQLFQDGMCLRSGDDSFQIVVRRTADEMSFVVTVATAGTAPGSSLAFDTMQTITKQFILGENGNSSSSWRGNVQVREFGLHPTLLIEAGGIPLEALLERLRDPQQRGENLGFYCGLERHRERGLLVPCLLQEVLTRLAAVDRKLDEQHGEVVSRLEALADGVSALCVSAEKAEEALQRAEEMGATSQEQLTALIEVLTAALLAAGPEAATEGSDAPAVGKVAQSLAQSRDQLRSGAQGGLSDGQLQRMKEEIVGEFSKLAEGMQQAAYEQLQQAEEAQAQRLQQLLSRNREAAVADLEAAMEALRVQQSQTQSVGGIPTAVTERLQQLQASLDAVRAAQDADSYGLHEVPLLVEVAAAQPTGTVKDAAKRCLYEIHRLHFCCPACGKRAASGPNKHGYELRSTRGWVQQAARVLKVTLFALQVASLVTPLPLPRLAELAELLPVADAKAVAGALDFVRKQVQDNTTATIGAVRAAMEQLPPAQLQALSVTREHVSSVRALLLKASDGIPPKDSGLAPVVCAGTRECAWVCAGCSGTYRERGNACLAVKISLD